MKTLVELNDLSVVFKQPNNVSIHALNGIDLKIFQNETLGLIGESGSGKSTLGKTMLGLNPYGGNINIFNETLNIEDKNLVNNIRKEIGVVFQEPFQSLNPRMKIKNILSEPLIIHNKSITKDEIEIKTQKAMESVLLEKDQLEKYPSQLSGGQQQRLALLRALQVDRPVLILDEATSALDSALRDVVFQLLKERAQAGCNVILVTHDKELAQQCDTVLNLDAA